MFSPEGVLRGDVLPISIKCISPHPAEDYVIYITHSAQLTLLSSIIQLGIYHMFYSGHNKIIMKIHGEMHSSRADIGF